MPRFRLHIAAVGLLVALIAAAGCKYTGGQADEGADDERTSGSAGEESAHDETSRAEQAARPQQAQQDAYALGEGTPEQRELMTRAKRAFLTNDLAGAEELFSQLAQTRPVSGPQVSAVIALAQIYNESGRADKALALYEGLGDRVEDVPEVQLVVARALGEQGESARAIEAYKELLDTQPNFVFALVELAELYAQNGQKEEASKTLYRYEKRVYSMAKTLESPETAAGDKINILDVFSLVSDDRATKAVVEVLSHDEPAVRLKAATVLGETGAVEAKEPLQMLAARDEHPDVRGAAKRALAQLPDVDQDDGAQIGPKMVDDKDELPVD